jgi:hypothetical protein
MEYISFIVVGIIFLGVVVLFCKIIDFFFQSNDPWK